jgi:hypothetical protein
LPRDYRACSNESDLDLPSFLDFTQRRMEVPDVSGQPIGPIFRGQAVQEKCREQLDTQLYREWVSVIRIGLRDP